MDRVLPFILNIGIAVAVLVPAVLVLRLALRKAPRWSVRLMWVLVAVTVCVTVAVCFLVNPIPCDHTYESAVTLQSTCAKPGEKTFTCTACKQSYVQMIPVLAHAYGEDVVLTAASCTAEGMLQRTCADCGTVTEKSIPMQPHAYGEEYKVIQGATCVQTGIHAYTCADCGYTQEQEVPTNDMHAFTQTVIRAASCVDPGEIQETCVLCGMVRSVEAGITDHNYKETRRSSATCGLAGFAEYTCAGCGDSYTKTIPAYTSHNYVLSADKSRYSCSHCKYTWKRSEYEIHNNPNPPATIVSPINGNTIH